MLHPQPNQCDRLVRVSFARSTTGSVIEQVGASEGPIRFGVPTGFGAGRNLSQLDTADSQEPSEALAAKTVDVKEKLRQWLPP